MPFDALFVCILGAILGSFLNVLILRLREGVTILGRSRCVHCEQQLKARHLVPILSWLVLGGRCAFCRRPIHVQYPLVEIGSMLLLFLAYVRHPFFLQSSAWPAFTFESLIFLTLLALVTFDLRWKVLPIEPMVIAAAVALVWNGLSGALPWTSILGGAVFGAVFLGAQVLLSRGRWMGEGDPWLGVLMGAFLGWPAIGIAFYLTYVGGGLLMLVLLLAGVIHRGTRVPFAPFLALGTLGALLFGTIIEQWMRLIL